MLYTFTGEYPVDITYMTNSSMEPAEGVAIPESIANWIGRVWFFGTGCWCYTVQRDGEWGMLAVQEFTSLTAIEVYHTSEDEMLQILRENARVLAGMPQLASFDVYAGEHCEQATLRTGAEEIISHISVFFPAGTEPVDVWQALCELTNRAFHVYEQTVPWPAYADVAMQKWPSYCAEVGVKEQLQRFRARLDEEPIPVFRHKGETA